jgi:GNAT superfamily N-acetyltransferase
MFVTPDIPHPSMWDMIRVGILKAVWLFGFAPVRRLLQTKDWYEAKEIEIFGARVHDMVRLERMTVLPKHQGKGMGSQALKTALDEADSNGVAVFLATQEERNVVFYSRLGFEVADESFFEPGSPHTPIKNWFMIREPSNKAVPVQETAGDL